MESEYGLGGPVQKKPHVVYGPDGERLGVYHINYKGNDPMAVVQKGVLERVKPNTNPRRPGTFVALNPEVFRRFK